MDELGAELGVSPGGVDLDVLSAGALDLALGVPAEGDHPQPGLLGLGDGFADLFVEPALGHVVSIRHLLPVRAHPGTADRKQDGLRGGMFVQSGGAPGLPAGS